VSPLRSRLSSGAAERTSFSSVFSSKSAAARAQIAQIRNECGARGTLRVSVAEARDLPPASEGSQVFRTRSYVVSYFTLDVYTRYWIGLAHTCPSCVGCV
jgi:hypothetical protein